MYPIVKKLQRQQSIFTDSAQLPNSIHGSVENQQNLNNTLDMIRHQQLMMATQLPTMLSYNDIKPLESINNATIYTYRGKRIAGFELQGFRMICLPQIRALRSLGAIQHGVNRCKLISCKDFDQLYDDCHKIHHRSGRPAKRSVDWENAPCEKSKKQKYNSDPTQQIVVQHLMATAATTITASESVRSDGKTMDNIVSDHEFRFLQTVSAVKFAIFTYFNIISLILSINSERSSVSSLSRSTSLPSLPLNLTKNVNNYQYENDSNTLQKAVSSNNSKFVLQNNCFNQNASTEDIEVLQVMLNKIIALIEVATLNLKTERELIENEKSFIYKFQRDLECKQSEYDKIQRELSMEQQKAKIYFRRYCKAKR
uniref:Ski_Sno domain-containing protein n=1 Tax=Onchocerca volvulus TaxID=6282 RepID=A0A8R1Y3Z1_ONCVO